MPVQADDKGLAGGNRRQPPLKQLDNNQHGPADTEGYVQTVGTQQHEEAGQEGAGLHGCPFMDIVGKLVDFHKQKARPQQQGDYQPTQ
ncbi:hypothetical protein D3C73_1583980 [compost metagenome]